MARKTKPDHSKDFERQQTQQDANRLLVNTIADIRPFISDLYWAIRPEEDQLDKGIDFQVELVDKVTSKTIFIFKIQNKGTRKALKTLKSTENKGLLSFPILIKHVDYYRYQIPESLIFTMCDLETQKVYWHPIQLDDFVDELVEAADPAKDEYVRIYPEPTKVLNATTVKQFLEDVNQSHAVQTARFRANTSHHFTSGNPGFVVDTSKHILDQLYDLAQHFDQLAWIVPIHLFSRVGPFKNEKTYTPHYDVFGLNTDNIDILTMLSKVKIEDHNNVKIIDASYFAGVADAANKLTFVFSWLSRNLVFDIKDKHGQNGTHIHLRNYQPVRPLSTLNKLLLKDFFAELVQAPRTIEEKMAQAYCHYQLGNLNTAIESFKKLRKEVKRKNLTTLYFVCQYNLSLLGKLMHFRYWEKEHKETIAQLRKINLTAEFEGNVNEHNRAFLSWINDKSFYTSAMAEIDELLGSIRDQYRSGGYSSNNYGMQLFTEFGKLETFFNRNYIVFDNSYEFSRIIERFIEGLFASHACTKEGTPGITVFDDYLLSQFVFYAKSEHLIKYFNRYHLKKIPYKKTDENEHFILIALNLLDIPDDVDTILDNYAESENRHIHQHINQLIGNALTICSLFKFDKEDIVAIARALLKYLSKVTELNYTVSKRVSLFIDNTSAVLPRELLREFFYLFLSHASLHKDEIIESLSDQLRKNSILLPLSNEQFGILQTVAQANCAVCCRNHEELYGELTVILENPAYKDYFVQEARTKLAASFDAKLYYFFAVMDVLPFDDILFNQFIDDTIPKKGGIALRSLFDTTRKYVPYLDELLNLCFKYDIDLKSNRFDEFRGLDSYYDWLLDLNGFDYAIFKPRWLKKYPTAFYFNAFRKVPRLKMALVQYLRDNRDPEVERVFFDLYKDSF